MGTAFVEDNGGKNHVFPDLRECEGQVVGLPNFITFPSFGVLHLLINGSKVEPEQRGHKSQAKLGALNSEHYVFVWEF
jgi:hypothetical protein